MNHALILYVQKVPVFFIRRNTEKLKVVCQPFYLCMAGEICKSCFGVQHGEAGCIYTFSDHKLQCVLSQTHPFMKVDRCTSEPLQLEPDGNWGKLDHDVIRPFSNKR